MFWKLLVVLCLVVACAKAWKRFGHLAPGAPAAAAGPQPPVQVRSTVSLAPGKLLHVVTVGEERFLLASSAQSINLIAKLDEAQPSPAPATEPAPESTSASGPEWLAAATSGLFTQGPAAARDASSTIASWFNSASTPEGPPAATPSLFQRGPAGKADRDA